MTDLRTAAQQALEALEAICEADTAGATPKMVIEARSMCEPTITALRAALAEPVLAPAPGYCKHCKQYTIEEPLPAEPVQEPVAWVWETSHELAPQDAFSWVQTAIHKMPLYTAPPQQAEPVEPVAWVRLEAWKSGQSWPDDCFTALPAEGLTPLYFAPPQRKED